MARHTIFVRRPGVIEHPSLLVRLVTVHTGRNLVGFLFPQPSLDDLYVHCLDASMAGRACAGHSIMGNGRSRIGMGEDVVRRMA